MTQNKTRDDPPQPQALGLGTALGRRRWWVPEVVQTSGMDCGPAALKCLLEGFHVSISYGRLREACQTDVDGTSIDTLEVVAQQLGLSAQQELVPQDHVLSGPPHDGLPAIAVVQQASGATHFVVVWRRWGRWLQIMDPAVGRRWVRWSAFSRELYQHSMSVKADQWLAWAKTEEFLQPLQQRLQRLGGEAASARDWLVQASQGQGWFELAALDASARLVQALVEAGGVRRGRESAALVHSLWQQTCQQPQDIYHLIPASYWSVVPDIPAETPAEAEPEDGGEEDLSPRVLLRGVVLLRILGQRAHPLSHTAVSGSAADSVSHGEDGLSLQHGLNPRSRQSESALPALSPELQAALRERPEHPLQTVWRLLRKDGLLAPLALAGASLLAAGVVVVEALLMRGLFDIAGQLARPDQRWLALGALVAFMVLVLALELPIQWESLRQGRHLEVRLRMALLRKLVRLNDRYFQSRPISDMADRSHSIHHVRGVPHLALELVETVFTLALTLLGIALLAPDSLPLALLLCGLAFGLPWLIQPVLNERDLRVRNHAGALNGFYLDALLGLVPVRAHQAQHNVQRQHESLLVEWAQAWRGLVQWSVCAGAMQSVLTLGLAGGLLWRHFVGAGGIGGGDLLLVFWVLKLPALGSGVADLAQQYPAQRNALLRLLEPLSAPDDVMATQGARAAQGDSVSPSVSTVPGASRASVAPAAPGVAIEVRAGTVLAAGHEILQGIDLHIAPGEHVAIVGPSGAGKSSLLGLLLGWHRLSQGRVTVEGRPLDAAGLERLRRVTAWVDPGLQIWNRSFLDNLTYASESAAAGAGMGRVGEAIGQARLRGVLEKLPQGLQTLLGEGGSALSGGEGQRVRLGRALLTESARLVLLDEPFRGLDRQQRHELLLDARQWWAQQTLLCVTHDVGETLAFDRVLVVANGRIVEDGSPRVLASQASQYRELLQAESRLRRSLWQGQHWRRLRVHQGRVSDEPPVQTQTTPPPPLHRSRPPAT